MKSEQFHRPHQNNAIRVCVRDCADSRNAFYLHKNVDVAEGSQLNAQMITSQNRQHKNLHTKAFIANTFFFFFHLFRIVRCLVWAIWVIRIRKHTTNPAKFNFCLLCPVHSLEHIFNEKKHLNGLMRYEMSAKRIPCTVTFPIHLTNHFILAKT